MQDLTYVTYCGLYCKLCDNLARIPPQASSLHKTLQKGGWEYFGPDLISGFKEFWAVLEQLSQVDPNFKGCRGGKCGNPDCSIRKCAQSRQQSFVPHAKTIHASTSTSQPSDTPILLVMEDVSKRQAVTSGSRNKKKDVKLVSVTVILDMIPEASSNIRLELTC